MSDQEDVDGEEVENSEEKNELDEPKPPSIIQMKLAEQGAYIAKKFDLLFATTAKLEADIVAVYEFIKITNEAKQKEFNTKLELLSNRVLTIEKERAAEKPAAEAARRAALGLPLEEIDPFEKFNKMQTDLGVLVRSNPDRIDQAVLKLEEALSMLGLGAESPTLSSEKSSPPLEEEVE